MANLELINISKQYDNGYEAVNNINIKVEDKEFITIIGPSGSGKSTTLRMIAGLENPTNGKIYIDNKLVNNIEPKNRDVAMVFQNYALFPHMSVYNNIAFSLKLKKFNKDIIRNQVMEIAIKLGIENLLKRKPSQLSGGERQRVAIGRALVCKPKIFLMDEPLSNLDAKLRVEMRALIYKLHKEFQITTIYVTHDQVEAMTLGSRVVLMDKGKVIQIDSPNNLYNNPTNLFAASFIGNPQMNLIKGKVIYKNNHVVFKCNKYEFCIDNYYGLNKIDKIHQDIILGVRAEDIKVYNDNNRINNYINEKISYVEILGSEKILWIDTNDMNLKIKVDSDYNYKLGDNIKFSIDLNKIYLFDKDTGKLIA